MQVATYTDYDEFLGHDLDAVILANFFHQHAPFAVKALRSGKHVMSEITACKTLGEAVALVRAVEDSGKIYMLAENYVYFAYVQEMRRLYRAGEIGEMQFGEGEYMSPFCGGGLESTFARPGSLAKQYAVNSLLHPRARPDYVRNRHDSGQRQRAIDSQFRERRGEHARSALRQGVGKGVPDGQRLRWCR